MRKVRLWLETNHSFKTKWNKAPWFWSKWREHNWWIGRKHCLFGTVSFALLISQYITPYSHWACSWIVLLSISVPFPRYLCVTPTTIFPIYQSYNGAPTLDTAFFLSLNNCLNSFFLSKIFPPTSSFTLHFYSQCFSPNMHCLKCVKYYTSLITKKQYCKVLRSISY